MKPKICLVCDIPNWAFDIIAKMVQKSLSDEFEIRIDYYDMREKQDELYEFIEKNDDCDLIHFFWRKSLLQIETEAFRKKVEASGRNLEEYLAEKRHKISTSIHDFMFLEPENILLLKEVLNHYAGHYYVNSKKLYQEYVSHQEFKKPDGIVHDVCDVSRFQPMKMERFEKTENDTMVIGWVGNSKGQLEGIDLKGFNTLLKPDIEELIAEGYNIKEDYADRNIRWRTTEEMPEYYSEIELLLCASIHESTPLPVLEAMSCGVPIVTTDVGVVREAFGEKQQAWIIGDRELGKNDEQIKARFKEAMIELYHHRVILKELSEENQKSIVAYDGGKIIKEFETYFKMCIEK